MSLKVDLNHRESLFPRVAVAFFVCLSALLAAAFIVEVGCLVAGAYGLSIPAPVLEPLLRRIR